MMLYGIFPVWLLLDGGGVAGPFPGRPDSTMRPWHACRFSPPVPFLWTNVEQPLNVLVPAGRCPAPFDGTSLLVVFLSHVPPSVQDNGPCSDALRSVVREVVPFRGPLLGPILYWSPTPFFFGRIRDGRAPNVTSYSPPPAEQRFE